MISRRRFLHGSTLAGVASGLPFPHVLRAADRPLPTRRPRHIIHMVADGMSLGTLTCADHLSQKVRQGRALTWVSLFQNPNVVQAWVNMRSLNSLVTDSAAAASSWGSGSRVINGSINQLPDGRDLKTLYELFGDKGWKRGLVTTTEITHATPAGFAANVDDRETGARIALQYLNRKIDLLLGGGQKFFDPLVRRDKRDLETAYKRAGYHVMHTAEELKAAPKDARWLGVFSRSHLPFTVDQVHDPKLMAEVPTLAQMTSAALRWLEPHRNFILQVEGGRIDQACHNCDVVSALRDQVAFDEAIDVVLEFQRRVPDTLVVITTDHGNGNPGLNGIGDAYGQSSHLFANILETRMSFPKLLEQLRTVETLPPDPPVTNGGTNAHAGALPPAAAATNTLVTGNTNATAGGPVAPEESDDDSPVGMDDDDANEAEPPDPNDNSRVARRQRRRARQRITVASTQEIQEAIRAATGYKVPPKKVEMLAAFLARKGSAMYNQFNCETAQLGLLLSNHTGLCFTGHSHTSDYVPLSAIGPGSELFRGFLQNTDLFRFYTTLAGIDFRNPTEPLIADAATAGSVERVEDYLKG